MLWGDETLWQELPEPVGYMDDVVVAFLFVYGDHDLFDLCLGGRVVPLLPKE